MNPKPNPQPLSPTGPLTPADHLGHFSYRDGIWFLSPSPVTVQTPTPGR